MGKGERNLLTKLQNQIQLMVLYKGIRFTQDHWKFSHFVIVFFFATNFISNLLQFPVALDQYHLHLLLHTMVVFSKLVVFSFKMQTVFKWWNAAADRYRTAFAHSDRRLSNTQAVIISQMLDSWSSSRDTSHQLVVFYSNLISRVLNFAKLNTR